MEFNQLVARILNEERSILVSKNIPAMDGKREIYYVCIDSEFSIHYLKRAGGINLTRQWDGDVGTVANYNQALHQAINWYTAQATTVGMSEADIKQGQKDIEEELYRLIELPGKWKIMDVYGNELNDYSEAVRIGLDVDIAHLRKSDINNELINKDVAGLEDIL